MESYLSEKFINEAWPLCSQGLRRLETKKHYYGFVEEISDYLKCDFLKISQDRAKKYFEALYTGELCKKNGHPFTASSVEERYRVLRSISHTIEKNKAKLKMPNYISPFAFYKTTDEIAAIATQGLPSADDIFALMKACVGGYSYMRRAIALAFFCGLTVSELEMLRNSDFHYVDNVMVTVKVGAGIGFEREVLVPWDIILVFSKEDSCDKDAHYFTTRYGTKVAARDFQRGIKKVGSRWTMAELRNAAGFRFYKNSGSIEATAKFLGVTDKNIYRFIPGAHRSGAK